MVIYKVYNIIFTILLIVLLVGFINVGFDKYRSQGSYQDSLKVKIDSLYTEIKFRDSLYALKTIEKDKITIIRERITIDTEVKKINQLQKDLEIIKSKIDRDTTKVSTTELLEFFNKLLE